MAEKQNRCACGCGQLTGGRFARGHQLMYKRQLLARIEAGGSAGAAARRELAQLGWSTKIGRPAGNGQTETPVVEMAEPVYYLEDLPLSHLVFDAIANGRVGLAMRLASRVYELEERCGAP